MRESGLVYPKHAFSELKAIRGCVPTLMPLPDLLCSLHFPSQLHICGAVVSLAHLEAMWLLPQYAVMTTRL